MNDIQQQYDAACKDMSPAERVARMTDMFNWARELVGRVVRQENPEANTEELKLLVALRMYGSDPTMRKMLERRLEDVSD